MQSNNINERSTLLRRNSLRVNYEADTGEVPKPMAGGTVLGIHNLAIVFPQFIVGRSLLRSKVV
jgi:solute carrier family 45 protein 1/2/4